jgi:hypothetical protein
VKPGPTTQAGQGPRAAGQSPRTTRGPVVPVASPLTGVPFGERSVGGGGVVQGGAPWDGGSLQAATQLSVPIALGGLVIVFMIVQWLIDRRDPKFVEAPARKDDGSIGFE